MKKQRKPPRSKRTTWKMKLTSIFLPFVLFTTGGIFLYAVLYGYFAYQAAIASPRFLSILFLLLISLAVSWESTKKKRLNLIESHRFDVEKWLRLLAMMTVLVPGFFVGEYIDKGVGKIIDLGSIKEIADAPPARFYTVDQYFVNSDVIWSHSQIRSTYNKSGKREIETYCMAPVYSTSQLGSILVPVAWIGKTYKSPLLYRKDLEEVKSEFISGCKSQFGQELQPSFQYFERVKFTRGNGFYQILQKRMPESLAASSQIVLIPLEGLPEEQAEGLLYRALCIYCICSFIFWVIVTIVSV